jgi:tetratricopeptide (TPR) repeat protein
MNQTRLAFAVVALILMPLITLAIERGQKGNAVTDPTANCSTLLSQADDIFQSRDYAAALEAYTDVAQKAREEFNRSIEVEALSQMARMNLLLGNKEEGREWLEQARERSSDNDPLGWSRYLGVRGRFEWKDDDLTAARQTFDTMYTYCNTNALYGRAIDAAHMIAIVVESPEEQIEWGKRGIEAAEAGDVESWLGPLWNNLAGTYYDLGQYDSALTGYEKAREFHWQYSGEVAKLYADYSVGMTHRKLGDFETAGQWLRPCLAWAERLGNHGAIGQCAEDLGEIAVAQGDKTGGLALLKRARTEYKAEGYDQSWTEVWDNINKRINELE